MKTALLISNLSTIEAQLLCDFLQNNGVQCFMGNGTASDLYGGSLKADIWVEEDQLELAQDLLKRRDAGEFVVDEDK